MKMNWGAGLVVSFIVFAAAILAMVFVSMNKEVNLVSDDYYQQELRHQDQIESAQRSNLLAEQPSVGVSAAILTLKLPRVFSADNTSGTLTFYRPADRKKDFVVALRLDSGNTQVVPTGSMQKGLWRLKVRWSDQNQSYYHEEPIVIQ